MQQELVIATRGSKLALWQANHVADLLRAQYPMLQVRLKTIKTSGDKIQDVPLAKIGGKALFVKEIEEALLAGEADLAVHSMKDVPAELPQGLKLGVVPRREDFSDCLLSNAYPDLYSLPEGSVVGTSSLRRQAQLLALRPDLEIRSLRGNLDTRIRKLQQGEFTAIVVASAGLQRLGLQANYVCRLQPPDFLPAIGQGALALEYLEDNRDLEQQLAFLEHGPTRFALAAERAFLHELEGGCQVPIGGLARQENDSSLLLQVLVADLKGQIVLRRQAQAGLDRAETLGREVARDILDSGGKEILQEIYSSEQSE
ncbi:MAG: hydroxymethylbilane synthase [Thermodesulfobacteriota bacterium]